jgi:hypothetical protein
MPEITIQISDDDYERVLNHFAHVRSGRPLVAVANVIDRDPAEALGFVEQVHAVMPHDDRADARRLAVLWLRAEEIRDRIIRDVCTPEFDACAGNVIAGHFGACAGKE